jgi:Zn-dependent protease
MGPVVRDRGLVSLVAALSGLVTGLIALVCSVFWLKWSVGVDSREILFVASPLCALATAALTATWVSRSLLGRGEEPSAPPADDAWDSATEQLFWDTRSELAHLGQRQRPKLGLVTSALAFVLIGFAVGSLARVLVVMLVLLVHEAGHLLAMRLFGYRDTRVFFIPGFGAATTGVKEDARPGQRVVVLLAGPVPGILLGAALLLVGRRVPAIHQAAELLIWLNAFNLLPLSILDGGKLLSELVFSRHYFLEAAFLAITSMGLVWLGLGGHSWLVGAVGAFTWLLVPTRARVGRVARAVRQTECELGPEVAKLDEVALRTLFRLAYPVAAGGGFPRSRPLAAFLRSVHAEARLAPAPVLATFVLLGVYAITVAVSLCAVVLTVYLR